jgi:hypothetical protein
MKWDQIAERWAAMAERMRSEGPRPGQGAAAPADTSDALQSDVPPDPAAPAPVPLAGPQRP